MSRWTLTPVPDFADAGSVQSLDFVFKTFLKFIFATEYYVLINFTRLRQLHHHFAHRAKPACLQHTTTQPV